MHDRTEGGGGPRGDRDERGPDDRPGDGPDSGGGPDTRFLDFEIPEVLYHEAESLTRDAVRELLLEAAIERVRERMGDKLEALARLAVDELMTDVEASLDIASRIEQRNEARGRSQERVREILGGGASSEKRSASSSRRPAKGKRGRGR